MLDEASGMSNGLNVKEFIAALAFCILTGLKVRVENTLLNLQKNNVSLFCCSQAKENNGVAARGGIAASVFLLLCTATNGSIPARLHGVLGISSFYIKHMFSKSVDMLSLPDLWETQKFIGGKKGPKGRAHLQVNLVVSGNLSI